jgi:hypothetical protein
MATVLLVVCPAYICFGYNMAVSGGLLTLPSFTAQFPLMNTLDVTGSELTFHSNIQGTVAFHILH